MRPDGSPNWIGLALRLVAGAGVAVALVVLGRSVSLEFAPTPTVLLCLLFAALLWLYSEFEEPAPGPDWQQPQPHTEPSRFSADVRTRRLASMLVHAQPGQGFDAGPLARTLAGLASERLVRSHGLPAEDPLADADGHLSPALLDYLRTADGDHPQILNRRTLHAHLKEIDAL